MSKIKKMLALLTAFTIVLTTFTACGGSDDSGSADKSATPKPTVAATNTDDTAKSDDGTGEEAPADSGFTLSQKFDPPITLTTDRWISSEEEMTKWDENPLITWTRENLGIIWKPKFVAANYDDHNQKLTLLAASNDLPDVLADAGGSLNEYYSKGFLRVIEDDIRQWGSPMVQYLTLDQLREIMGKNAFSRVATDDGKAFAIPLTFDPLEAMGSNKLFYRKDLADEMGYDEPTNVKELEDMMQGFVDKYNKPALFAAGTMLDNHYLFTLFGVQPRAFYERDGELVYGSVQPEMKQALATFADWYKRGIIAADFDTKSFWDELKTIPLDNYMVNGGEVWFPGAYQTMIEENYSKALLWPLPLLEGANGKVNPYYIGQPMGWPAAITTNCEYPEAVIYEMNELYESYQRNDPVMRERFGNKYPITPERKPINPEEVAEKGAGAGKYDYTAEEEGPGFLNAGRASSISVAYGFKTPTFCSGSVKTILESFNKNNGDMSAIEQDLEGSALSYFRNYYLNHGEVKGFSNSTGASLNNYKYLSDGIANGTIKFDLGLGPWGFFSQALEDYWFAEGGLEDQEKEIVNKIIKGEVPVDDYDKFITDWYANGGEEILKDRRELYNKLK